MAVTKASLGRQTDLNATSQKIINVLDPTAAQDAATKAYVDSVAAGFDPKGSVRAATTTNGALATAYENGDTIDGITLATGDRILIKDQSAGAENGIYTVNATGAPTRATDFDTSAEVTSGASIFVDQGTANADTTWVLTTNDPIVLATTALVFTQFSGLGQVTAGAGLTKTGNTLNVGAGTGITVNADDVAIDTAVVSRKADFVDRETPSGTVNGSNVTFTLANTPTAGSEHVYLNGLLQEPGSGNDYTISAAVITYLTAPLTGDKIRVSYRK